MRFVGETTAEGGTVTSTAVGMTAGTTVRPWHLGHCTVLPAALSGIIGSVMLALGRALGETMAVAMLIGNTSALGNTFKDIFFGPGNTMASVIANEFTEADHTLYYSGLIELGLVLFFVTVIINLIGRRIITKFTNN